MLKLDRDSRIVYSTLFGGPGNPYPTGIAVNRNGEAFVTGANGGDLPPTDGAIATKGRGTAHSS